MPRRRLQWWLDNPSSLLVFARRRWREKSVPTLNLAEQSRTNSYAVCSWRALGGVDAGFLLALLLVIEPVEVMEDVLSVLIICNGVKRWNLSRLYLWRTGRRPVSDERIMSCTILSCSVLRWQKHHRNIIWDYVFQFRSISWHVFAFCCKILAINISFSTTLVLRAC